MIKEMNQTKVYKLLEKRKSVFLNQVKDAINIADDMLPQINNVFNTYTIHGMKHSINVVEYMFDLIENAEEMSDLELVMIIYAALFHDSGMIVSDDEIVGMQLDHQGDSLLIVSENGMGKRTYLEEFTVQKRGGKGVKCYKITEKTGFVVGVKAVVDSNEIMMITTGGVIIQLRMDDISTLGRITSGVKMINLDEGVKVAQIAKVREKVSNGDQEFENLDDAMETIPDEEKYPVQDEDEEITLPKEEEDE